MKPAVGFMLPSAGVTPAPSTNRKMARTPFCSQILSSDLLAFFLWGLRLWRFGLFDGGLRWERDGFSC